MLWWLLLLVCVCGSVVAVVERKRRDLSLRVSSCALVPDCLCVSVETLRLRKLG